MKYKQIVVVMNLILFQSIIAMDEPKPLSLTQFNEQKQAFAELTNNNARLLKNLVAQEQRGNYCPELYKAEEIIGVCRYSTYMDWHIHIGFPTKMYLHAIAKKSAGYNKLISAFNNEKNLLAEDLFPECRKILEKNRYIANTYGSCEPYQDRIITPLHYVLAKVSDNLWPMWLGLSFCDLLLSCGAHPNAKDDVGNNLMHHAYHPELIELLCSYGAETNIQGERGRTALLNNIRLCNWPAAECLLEYSTDPNKKDDKRNTPLKEALARTNPAMVKLLLASGADWTEVDGKNIGKKTICLSSYMITCRILIDHIKTLIKDLLVKPFNLTAIENIIHSPCSDIIDIEMGDEFIEWIPKECIHELVYANSGANRLLEFLAKRKFYRSIRND